MRSYTTSRSFFSLLVLAVSSWACSSSNPGSDSNVAPSGAAPAPPSLASGISVTDPNACIVTTRPGGSAGTDDALSTRRWRSYVAEQRLVRDIAIDADGTPLASGSSTYTKLDETGHTLVLAIDTGSGVFDRSDFARDGHGNSISFREVLTRQSDLETTPPEAPSQAYNFINHYSSAGLLYQHNRTDSGASTDYQHDTEGRCQLIFEDQRFEDRQYDANDRLSLQLVGPYDPATPIDLAAAAQISTLHSYDDQGRPLAVEQDGGGPAALPIDGQADVQTFWTYADDGSWQVEHIDFTSDTPNDRVERNGSLVDALHQIESWSVGCAALEAQIPAIAGNECRSD